jgi:hypothetical protein
MKKYKVYFQIGDKKMVKEIFATSQESAKSILTNSIIFHKVDEIPNSNADTKLNDLINEFNTFFKL